MLMIPVDAENDELARFAELVLAPVRLSDEDVEPVYMRFECSLCDTGTSTLTAGSPKMMVDDLVKLMRHTIVGHAEGTRAYVEQVINVPIVELVRPDRLRQLAEEMENR